MPRVPTTFYEIFKTRIPRSVKGDEKLSCRRQVQAYTRIFLLAKPTAWLCLLSL